MASQDKTINTNVFTFNFLQSLSNLTKNSLNSPETTKDRVKKIKIAAYISMAKSAGGSKKLWSRALLRGAVKENSKKLTWQMRRRRRRRRRRSNRKAPIERLRNLVPGGGEMETSKLMEETAHYIKCLSLQVKVMQCLVDGLCPK